MTSTAAWIAEKAQGADQMEIQCVLLPYGERMADFYRGLLAKPEHAHMAPAIRDRLEELEATLTTLTTLRGTQAA